MNTTHLLLFASLMALAVGGTHIDAGATLQDSAIATALEEGLTQSKYLALSYGAKGNEMLQEAIKARAEYYIESVGVITKLSNGDIRNIPCEEPLPNGTIKKTSYIKFQQKVRRAFFNPNDVTPYSGAMYGEQNAYVTMFDNLEKRVGLKIKTKGDVNVYKDYDTKKVSYSFWPLGCAIHSNNSYAEEVAHFYNFCDPRKTIRAYKGEWSKTDFLKVSRWNEYLSALRGCKVHAFSKGINLNESHITTKIEETDDGPKVVEVIGTPKWDEYYNSVVGELDSGEKLGTTISVNAVVLLQAYKEALSHEGKETDAPHYKRLRELCRNFKIARMVL